MSARFGALTLVALAALLGPAGADHEETEQRLKAAGVDEDLRARIHASIQRGVLHLLAKQNPDGSYGCELGGHDVEVEPTPGVTLVCALALRHAGTPLTVEPVTKAVAWLFEDDGTRLLEIETKVYEASLALLLLQAEGRKGPEAPRLASALARGLDKRTGWWGYDTPGPAPEGAPAEPLPFDAQRPNLSTSQFGALGLWAAKRMGIAVPASVWRRHAEGLTAVQTDVGSWPYNHPSVLQEGAAPAAGKVGTGKGYFTTTCMGLANVLLARQALKEPKAAPDAVLAGLAKAHDRALVRLKLDVPVFVSDPGAGEVEYSGPERSTDRGGTPGRGAFYTLYALEKACLFADLETLTAVGEEPRGRKGKKSPKVAWYARSAEWLLETQREDGGWGVSADKPTNVIDTAFALLVLVRAPSASHPTTPREVDAKPRGAVTPGDPPPEKPR